MSRVRIPDRVESLGPEELWPVGYVLRRSTFEMSARDGMLPPSSRWLRWRDNRVLEIVGTLGIEQAVIEVVE